LIVFFILVVENRLTSSTDSADLSSHTDKSNLNSTSSSSSSSSHSEYILFRAAEKGDAGNYSLVFLSINKRKISSRTIIEIS
jgi:hypothetical protein